MSSRWRVDPDRRSICRSRRARKRSVRWATSRLSDSTTEQRPARARSGADPVTGRLRPRRRNRVRSRARSICRCSRIAGSRRRAARDPPAVPRPPLAVRRSTPVSRARHRPAGRRAGPRSRSAAAARAAIAPRRRRERSPQPAESQRSRQTRIAVAAAAGPRLLAALVDAVILGSIAPCGAVPHAESVRAAVGRGRALPPIPFAAFCCCSPAATSPSSRSAGGQTDRQDGRRHQGRGGGRR